MKTISSILLAALLSTAAHIAAQDTPEQPPATTPDAEQQEQSSGTGKAPKKLPGGWILKWNDEFDGKKLDESKWAYELGVVRNPGASQAYTKDCVEVKNGMLLLHSIAKPTPNEKYREGSEQWREKIKQQPFASGSVTTRGVMSFTPPGRLEFRARIPKAKGVWPAIWTMHENNYGWPANGEIDILEHISQEPNKVYTIFRWGKNGTKEEYKPVVVGTEIPNYSRAFHTYVLEWDSEMMRVLIDNKEVAKTDIKAADYPNGDNPLQTPCYIIMNTAIGGPGTWPEKPDASQYPVTFEIDYVRYYTKKGAKPAPKPKKQKPQKHTRKKK